MLFTIIFILLLIWAAVVWSIYSNFLVFFENFEESQNYNKAYYEAISALERAELSIRRHEPWYVSSWWWKKFNGEVYSQAWNSDNLPNDFSYISNTSSSAMFWNVDSLTKRIPNTWFGNVDWIYVTWDSLNYNMMDYDNSEVFLFYYDKSKDQYWNADIQSSVSNMSDNLKLKWGIRLPIQIREAFWDLDDSHHLNWSNINDDAVVDWQINWVSSDNTTFTIFARQHVEDWNYKERDSTIRESDLNKPGWLKLNFYQNPQIHTPIVEKNGYYDPWNFLVVGSNADDISAWSFLDIFHMSWVQLKFSLLNLLKSEKWYTYPFLEYYLDFDGHSVPDRFYTINAEWKYSDFQVNLLFKKPTIEQSVLWSFTVIF